LQHERHVPVLKKRFRTGCELLAGCRRWTPVSTPPVPMAQRWPRSPRGPMPELSFARPPSPTAGHSNPIMSLRRQRASPVEARSGGVSKGRHRAPCPPWPPVAPAPVSWKIMVFRGLPRALGIFFSLAKKKICGTKKWRRAHADEHIFWRGGLQCGAPHACAHSGVRA
jgi:hypothetical protein